MRGHSKTQLPFHKNLLLNMMVEYHKKVKEIRRKVEEGITTKKINYITLLILKHNNNVIDNTITETIRILDTRKSEYSYIKS